MLGGFAMPHLPHPQTPNTGANVNPDWDPRPLEKALEAGHALRRDDYLRLFTAYFSAAKTRQDRNYGLGQP